MDNILIREVKYDIIKKKIDLRLLLQELDIDYKERGGELWAICPFHLEDTPSWSINNDKTSNVFGKYKCFGCGASGDWISLVRHVKGMTEKEAIDYVKTLFRIGPVDEDLLYQFSIDERKNKSKDDDDDFEFVEIELPPEFKKLSLSDPKAKPYWDYLKYRKISVKVALKNQAMYCSRKPKDPKNRRYMNRIIFPITMNGKIVSFLARTIDKNYKGKLKVLIPPGAPIARIMYGYDDLDRSLDYCIVCEGPFDRLRLESLGYKNVLANLGNHVTEHKINIVSQFKRIFIIPDADSGGEVLEDYFKFLKYKNEIYVVDLPPGEDPGSADPLDIRKAFIKCRKITESVKPVIVVDYTIKKEVIKKKNG